VRRKIRFIVLAMLLVVFLMPLSSNATTYYVKDGGSDGNDGQSWNQAFATIAKAVQDAGDGDDILVGYNPIGTTTYNITSSISISGENLRITSARVNQDNSYDSAVHDSDKCIIDANDNCRIFTITGTAVTNATVIRGFKITDGDAYADTQEYNRFLKH